MPLNTPGYEKGHQLGISISTGTTLRFVQPQARIEEINEYVDPLIGAG